MAEGELGAVFRALARDAEHALEPPALGRGLTGSRWGR
jgi:hypothetical protein